MGRFFSKRLVTAAFIVSLLCFLQAPRASAQLPGMKTLITPLAQKIAVSHKHRIVVFPLIGKDQENFYLGAWLAKQISAGISDAVTGLQMVDASSDRIPIDENSSTGHPAYNTKLLDRAAKKTGADIVVTGNFAPYGTGLGISLIASKRGYRDNLAESNGEVEITSEMKTLLVKPLDFSPPPDGVYLAGWGGVSTPKCVECPDPAYSDEARRNGLEGVVVLSIVIRPDGSLKQIDVEQSPIPVFAWSAVDTLKRWRLQPASGPNGKPVTARTRVVVTFRKLL